MERHGGLLRRSCLDTVRTDPAVLLDDAGDGVADQRAVLDVALDEGGPVHVFGLRFQVGVDNGGAGCGEGAHHLAADALKRTHHTSSSESSNAETSRSFVGGSIYVAAAGHQDDLAVSSR